MVSHLRDVGLIGTSYYDNDTNLTTGKKVVYIAPMKALVSTHLPSHTLPAALLGSILTPHILWFKKAQEVVEKFSSKLKSLGIIVRELTGDMQLSRGEAEAAHVSDR